MITATPRMSRRRRPGMRRRTAIVVMGFMMLASRPLPARAEPGSIDARRELARALLGAWLPLESGLAVSVREGTPLSAKYEIDDGAFQLSVYTWKSDSASGDAFQEVIVDFNTGLVARVDAITDGGDLTAAQGQTSTMARAKRSLGEATADVVRANAGYRAVSATPTLAGGGPLAEVAGARRRLEGRHDT